MIKTYLLYQKDKYRKVMKVLAIQIEIFSVRKDDSMIMTIPIMNKIIRVIFDVDEEALQTFAEGYIGPLKRFLLWMIPLGVAIYCLIKAIDWWRKDVESDGQGKSYWATVTKGITVGVIAWSIDLILTILGIGG